MGTKAQLQAAKKSLRASIRKFEIISLRDVAARLAACEEAFPPLLAAAAGHDIPQSVHSYEINSLLEHLGTCAAARLDSAAVLKIAEFILASDPELSLDTTIPDRMVARLELSIKITNFIATSPGITQFAAREQLAIDKGQMRDALRYMEAVGTIKRVPTERTNRLYVATAL